MIQIFHNNRCSKSRCAVVELEKSGQPFEVINYLETPPTETELIAILKKLNFKPVDLIRKTEKVYIEKYKNKSLSDNEWIEVMITNPILIERPIVIDGDKAIIARPTERMNEILM
ncbi:arsenate reductase (glutaredoxin) [Pedobacter changchengzhani]|uniref:Arsenate reductase (Glutaredoxin) n=1 Tax=Pedobacter changchengzhani TaxID=2529274 RepID=A0A4R5MK47_9SPHI|nr:arsenate reductase (glutaredoxin) [Pedobacter changchengzhani]TDG36024.1 arsenate reductase (glutaredoxin) [Pedobacter changchengzhani]